MDAANPGEVVEVFDANRFGGLFHFLAVVGQGAEKSAEFFAGDGFNIRVQARTVCSPIGRSETA